MHILTTLTRFVAQATPPATPPALPKVNIESLPHKSAAGQTDIKNILMITFAVIGAISVIMVIIGGIKYTGSQGDPAGTAKAKNTIIYALVGVVISVFAVTIVQFAIKRIFQQ